MIDINTHPVWKNVNKFKKQAHLFRLLIAKNYVKFYPSSKFVAITGSVGKTTTAIACKQVLSQKFNTLSTTDNKAASANLDPVFNIPITLLKINPWVKRVVLEMGIEYPGEMEFYLNLVKPETAIITRIFYQHSEFLGDLNQIIAEKGKLIEQLPKHGVAILNWDDPQVRKLASLTQAQILYYGTDPKHCHIWAGNIKIINFQTIFELNYGVERVEVKSNLLGNHQIYPLLAAATLGIKEGILLTRIKVGLEMVEGPSHRMQVKEGYNGSTIIDDTYNAAPIAVEEAIDSLKYITARRRIAVLGQMRELGRYSQKMHQMIAQKIFKDKLDLVFLGTGDTKYIADELIKLGFLKERIQTNLQNPQIVSKLLKTLSIGDVVLVKGARAVRLDEVVNRLIKTRK